MKTVLSVALALCAVQQRARNAQAPREPARPAAHVRCTPKTIAVDDAAAKPSENPLAEALTRAGPGTLIEVEAGDYPPFTLGFGKGQRGEAMTKGGAPGQPIVVRAIGAGKARIRANGGGDTIAIAQMMPVGHITFEGLTIVGGYRAAVIFYKQENPNKVHDGFRFIDCEINGAYDHFTRQGVLSKWGIWGHNLKDFEFKGVKRRASVHDICHEHAFYLQNARGDITIENVDAARIGRTFVQFTARASDGLPGTGTITVRNCKVEDACIAAGDNYKGGAAFTVAGRHEGTLLFEGNTYRAGFQEGIQKLTGLGQPYGTGAFVAWDNRQGANGKLVLRDNEFVFAKGCGDRPVVSIGGCREVELAGHNRFVAGASEPVLELDPLGERGLQNSANGSTTIAEATELVGRIRVRGEPAERDDLAALARPAEQE